MTDNAMAK